MAQKYFLLPFIFIFGHNSAAAQTVDVEKCKPSKKTIECPFVEGGSETFSKTRLQSLINKADGSKINLNNPILGPIEGYSFKLSSRQISAIQIQQQMEERKRAQKIPSGPSGRKARQAKRAAEREQIMQASRANMERSRARATERRNAFKEAKTQQNKLGKPSGNIVIATNALTAAVAIEEILRQDSQGWGGNSFYTANSVKNVKLIGVDGIKKTYSANYTYEDKYDSEIGVTFNNGKFSCLTLSMEKPFVPCRFIAPTTESRLMVAIIGAHSPAAQKLRDAQPKREQYNGPDCTLQYIGGAISCIAN